MGGTLKLELSAVIPVTMSVEGNLGDGIKMLKSCCEVMAFSFEISRSHCRLVRSTMHPMDDQWLQNTKSDVAQ